MITIDLTENIHFAGTDVILVEKVKNMYGNYRIPDVLKKLDSITKHHS